MSALEICKAALERGVLHQVTREGRTIGWRFGEPRNGSRRESNGRMRTLEGRMFSNQTVRALLNSKFATRAGGTVRKRDGVTWRRRNGQA